MSPTIIKIWDSPERHAEPIKVLERPIEGIYTLDDITFFDKTYKPENNETKTE